MNKIIQIVKRAKKSPEKVLLNIVYRLKLFTKNMPDDKYLGLLYKITFHKKINWNNPQSFNEKLQWLKLNDRKNIYTTMVDKYEAKKYVAKAIGEKYIIPTIGIYNDFNEIDFDKLPNQFVMKCTHDSGNVIVCKDKSQFDISFARKKINKSLKRDYYLINREWPYKNVEPRIIIEKYMENNNGINLIDYKFYCFNGKPEYLYVSEGLTNHSTAKIDFFDMNFKKAPFGRGDFAHYDSVPNKPKNFEKMKELSKKLAVDMKFLRVDFYEINGQIYFSELTFTPCGGFMKFVPEEWDKKLGELINLK